MNENYSSELGEIKIHKRLISQIAYIATLKVEGVSYLAFAAQKTISKIAAKWNLWNPIRIDVSRGPRIEIPVIVKYGYNVPDVAFKIQETVLKDLTKMLNIENTHIVVKVKGVEKEEA